MRATAAEAQPTFVKYPTTELEHLPGTDGLPLVGHTVSFFRDCVGLVHGEARRHGSLFRMKTFGYRQVVVGDAEGARTVLMDTDHNFSSTMGWNFAIGELFARGLMLRDFDDHRSHRLIMQTAFRNEAMREYTAMMNPAIEEGISRWPTGRPFLFYPAIKRLTLDLAAKVFLGIPLGAEVDALNRSFVDAVAASIAVVKREIPGLSFNRGMKGRRHLMRYFQGLIPKRRNGDGKDMFTQFCQVTAEDGARFSDDEIVDHMIFLMMAAHDTTTSTLSTMIWSLASNPQWQDRLRAEGAALGKPWMDYDDKDSMPQTDWVFKECMRCHPPVPFIPRRTVRECEIQGQRIPVNTGISVCSLLIHQQREYWDEPQSFDPERFSPQRAEDKRHSHSYLPFGGGAHTCIGMHFAAVQIKAFLHQFLARYRVRLKPGHRVTMVPIPIPKPKGGLPVVMERIG